MTIIVRNERDYDIRTVLRIHGLVLSGVMTLEGAQFLRPETTFMSPIYAEMARWFPEQVWGTIFLILGMTRFAVILTAMMAKNGKRTIPTAASIFTAGASSIVWLSIAVLFAKANPFGWSCIAAGGFFAMDLSTCIMVARVAGFEAGESGHGRTIGG
jgi:predicted neutral ceramidase superfamily lipid hydrolase